MRYLYDLTSFVIIPLVIYLVIRIIFLRKYRFQLGRETLKVTFVIYIFALIFIVWVKGSVFTENLRYNYIPFKTILGYLNFHSFPIALKNIVGNLLITSPLGFYAVFKIRLIGIKSTIVYALLLSILIEFVQFLLFKFGLGMRTIDIDDVILNTIGCILGYFITKFLFLKKKPLKI